MDDDSKNPQPPQDDSQTPSQNEEDYESLYLRAKADLENYRNQVAREKSDVAKFACENLILQILPILDNFKRASSHLPKDLEGNEWVKGVEGIEKQLEATLENVGLKKIEAKKGEACDANLHEAIAMGEGKEGEILEVLEEGYELNGKVLRASKVKVGDGKAKKDA